MRRKAMARGNIRGQKRKNPLSRVFVRLESDALKF